MALSALGGTIEMSPTPAVALAADAGADARVGLYTLKYFRQLGVDHVIAMEYTARPTLQQVGMSKRDGQTHVTMTQVRAEGR